MAKKRSPDVPITRIRTTRKLPPNKFKAKCAEPGCKEVLEPGEGFLERLDDGPRKWATWCKTHMPGNQASASYTQADLEPFVREVLKHPDDVEPRLVFADWLTEQGDPRGEFIHVQCQLAEMSANAEERDDLVKREQYLLRKHGGAWGNHIPATVHSYEFARGFVERIVMRTDKFLANGGEVLDVAPVRHVKLTHARDHIAGLAKCALLKRISSLGMKSSDVPMGAERAEMLLKSRMLGNLRELDLGKQKIRTGGIRALISSKHLGKVTELSLGDNALDDEALELLAKWSRIGKLVALDLRMNKITDAGLVALLKQATNLEVLDLNRNQVGPEGAAALAKHKKLRWLDLSFNQIGNEGAASLSASKQLAKLECLAINHNGYSPAAKKSLKKRFGDVCRFDRIAWDWQLMQR